MTVVTADAEYVRLILPGYSYLSSSELRAHFGLGATKVVKSIEVKWQDNSRERFTVPGVDRELTVRKGSGTHYEATLLRDTLCLCWRYRH